MTRHLEVLEAAGLVSRVRAGRESRFAYRAEPVDEAKAYLEAVGARWDEALGRLKALVGGVRPYLAAVSPILGLTAIAAATSAFPPAASPEFSFGSPRP